MCYRYLCETQIKILSRMTVEEAINATLANSARYKEVDAFTKGFRSDDLGNIEAGEEFTIPQNYRIISQTIMRDGQPVKNSKGEDVTAEFIKVQTNKGRVVNFFPSSLTKVAFRVNPETGKDVTEDRVVRTQGNIVAYVKDHPDMNATMQALKGCTIKLEKLNPIPVRRFGVSNEAATKEDVETNNIGTWSLVGTKKPKNWTVG